MDMPEKKTWKNQKSKPVKLNIRITAELKERIDNGAEACGCTLAEYIRRALESYNKQILDKEP